MTGSLSELNVRTRWIQIYEHIIQNEWFNPKLDIYAFLMSLPGGTGADVKIFSE